MSLIPIGQTAPRNTSFLPGSKFDVFLSFRGEDTRTNFTDHLYTALVEKGIHTFRDDEELERGERISQNLLQDIEASGVFIVILSENYANSKWCLNELVSIMERGARGRKVFPVFYHVDPSEVRKQSGKYRDAFADYEKDQNVEREQIQKWRDALTAAGHLGGYHIENQ